MEPSRTASSARFLKIAMAGAVLVLAGCQTPAKSEAHGPGQRRPAEPDSSSHVATTGGYAQIQAIRNGQVTYRVEGGAWRVAKIGLRFQEGDTVLTDGTAVLDLFSHRNGPVVRMTPGSQLRFDRLRSGSEDSGLVIDTVITLEKGRLLAATPKLRKRSVYRIVTLNRVVDLRSGQFEVSAGRSRLHQEAAFPQRSF